jgi:hypothetical protein
MTKAYLIDAAAQTVSEVTITGLSDLQKLVGGYIEAAYVWDSGDTLFVDEEGLLKEGQSFFAVPGVRPEQAFAGNGVLVGREEEGSQFPGGFINHDPAMSLEDLHEQVFFKGVRR